MKSGAIHIALSRLPGHMALVILIFTLTGLTACEEKKRFSPLEPGAVVLAFGDSVTHGVGAEGASNYPAYLATDTGWNVINAGVSGDTAAKARARIGELLAMHRPRLVIVELGGNDFLRQRPPKIVKEDLRAILRESLASGAITVLVAVPGLSLLRAQIGRLSDSQIYRELANEEPDVLLIENVFSEVLSDKSLRTDRIHPNARGYRELSDGFLEALRDAGIAL